MARVQIQIVTWNNRKDIAAALESIAMQTWRDFSVVLVDNASEDGTLDILKTYGKDITVLSNRKNLGFVHAQNQAYLFAVQSRTTPNYILAMNPDGALDPQFLEAIVHFADTHPEGASFTGKILREHSTAAAVIDSVGIMMEKSFRAYDVGTGEIDRGHYNQDQEVFGASGAMAFYRVSALKEVGSDRELYDPDFFMYKEDVDLAWRLMQAGFKSYYVSAALAYHARTMRKPKRGIIGRMAGELTKDPYKKYLSYRNQCLLLLKNLSAKEFAKRSVWILADRIGESLFMLCVHPIYFFRAHIDIFRLWKKMRRKRLGKLV